ASDNRVVIAYLNAVGGQDELVFDGHSLIFDQDGNLLRRGRQFEEEMLIADIDIEAVFLGRLRDAKMRQEELGLKKDAVEHITIDKTLKSHARLTPVPYTPKGLHDEIYSALVLGTRDYLKKNGFKSAVIGLSGGIDSSLVAAIAVDALQKENVNLVFMPSPFTSRESHEDAEQLALNLGIHLITVPITEVYDQYLATVKDVFRGRHQDVTEENIQARIRGNILMALSNKFGWLVLTTGNKSEMSVGYATLYGDMAGGFAVIKDAPKTLVYELARWRNQEARNPLIPERVLSREPTAELKEGQKDTDTLPPYPVLDPILKAYVEQDMSFEEILMLGSERATVEKVLNMVDASEYKRRQAPPGIKITERAFGRDRRFPITNRYRSF
ncbi:MAG: NAD+ synthase, partial [bacterium]